MTEIGQRRAVEPAGLVVLRDYKILWREQTYDPVELAYLRFEENLGPVAIARRLGISKTTAVMAVQLLEKAKGLR